MSSIVSYHCLLQCKILLSRGLAACARRDGMLRKGSLRCYSRFKLEYYPEEPMTFVAELSDKDRQKLKECLHDYSIASEDVEHIEKPSNRKLRLGN